MQIFLKIISNNNLIFKNLDLYYYFKMWWVEQNQYWTTYLSDKLRLWWRGSNFWHVSRLSTDVEGNESDCTLLASHKLASFLGRIFLNFRPKSVHRTFVNITLSCLLHTQIINTYSTKHCIIHEVITNYQKWKPPRILNSVLQAIN